jgi:hypothetical protein
VARALQAGALTTGSFNTALAARMIETGLAEEALRDMVAESVRRLGILRSVLGPDLALESAGTGFHVWIPMGREEAERVVSGALQESIALTPPSTVAVEGGEASGLRLCVGAVASDAELERALSTLRPCWCRGPAKPAARSWNRTAGPQPPISRGSRRRTGGRFAGTDPGGRDPRPRGGTGSCKSGSTAKLPLPTDPRGGYTCAAF